MKTSFSTMGLKALFRYPLQGKEWGRKLLFLALFYLGGFIIPVVPWLFSCGYFAAILRQNAAGDPAGDLPEWKDWSHLLMDGLRLFGAGLILVLPLKLLFLCGIFWYIVAISAGIGLAETGRDFLSFILMSGGISVLFCSIAFGMLLTLGLGLISGPAITHMVITGRFGALFHVKEWWKVLRGNLGGYLIAIFLFFGLISAIQMLGMTVMYTIILCGILPILLFVVTPYTTVVIALLFGQAYREGADALTGAKQSVADEPAVPQIDPVS